MSEDHLKRIRAMRDAEHGAFDLWPEDVAALAAIITERAALKAEVSALTADLAALLAYYAGPEQVRFRWADDAEYTYYRALMLDDYGNPVLREFPTLVAFAAAVKKAAKGVPDGHS